MLRNHPSYIMALSDNAYRNTLAKGEAGRRWIADLDAVVAEVTTAWDLEVDSVFARSSQGLVLNVRQADETRAVLKLGHPGTDLSREAHVYNLSRGRVLPKVIAHHPELNALLLEALGRSIRDLHWPPYSQMRVVCRTVQALWRTPTTGVGLKSGFRRAHGMRHFIQQKYQSLRAPCEAETIGRAFDYAAERADAHRDDASVLVHGDAHTGNTLTLLNGSEAPGAECRLIDPVGIYAEPAYDVAMSMRGYKLSRALAKNPAHLAQKRCAWLAELTGVDERAVWQWGLLMRVIHGLRMKQRGMEHKAAFLLGMANALAKVPPPP